MSVAGLGSRRCWRAGSAGCCAGGGEDLDDAVEDLFRDRQLAGVVGGGHPQAQDPRPVCSVTLRHDHVAEDLLILRPAPSTAKPWVSKRLGAGVPSMAQPVSSEVEPAAVLVGAFEVQVGARAAGVTVARSRAARASGWCRSRTTRPACR